MGRTRLRIIRDPVQNITDKNVCATFARPKEIYLSASSGFTLGRAGFNQCDTGIPACAKIS